MDQQQFKIRVSVSTKILLTISALLILPVIVINLSAVSLFTTDKKAYVYDSQATSVVLAGREFVGFLENSLGTLKLIVGSVDFGKPVVEQSNKNIQFYLDNQRSILGTELYLLDPAKGATLVHRQFQPSTDPAIAKVRIEPQLLLQLYGDLNKQGFAFQNISKAGTPPMLAILFGDNNRIKSKDRLAVAVGYASLARLVSGSSDSFNRFLIANRSGGVLFNSDAKLLSANLNIQDDEIFREAWSGTVNAAAREYISTQGIRTLGSYYKPGLDLVAVSQIDYEKAMDATYRLTEKFIVITLAALGAMIVVGLFFAKGLTKPLKRLFEATAQVSSGNFDVNLTASSRDEIGVLTTSFVSMSRRISALLEEMVDKVRVDQEVEIARTVQQSLFPPVILENEHLRIASHYQSASECGGDWWGYFRAGNKHVVIIADATGHGLPSALMTAAARSCFSVVEKLALDSGQPLEPAEMLSIANRVVYDSAQGKIMMTCFACTIDMDTRTISYASAAHNPPWLFSPGENGRFKLGSLVCNGQRLGETQTLAAPYEQKSMEFNRRDTLVFYTDGLLEGKNLSGEQYGKKQARQVLEGAMVGEPEAIISSLMKDFMDHNSGKALDDDVTLAVARIIS